MKITVSGDIDRAKTDGEKSVNNNARDLIRLYVPEGLAIIYSEKTRQARAVIASPGRTSQVDHRFVADDAESAGITMAAAASAIIDEADKWSAAATEIERLRRTANSSLREASTRADIKAAVAGVSLSALSAALLTG